MPRPAVIDKEVAEPEVVAVRKVFLEPLLADRGAAEPLVDVESTRLVTFPLRAQAPIVAGRRTGPQKPEGLRSANAHAEHTCTGVVALW